MSDAPRNIISWNVTNWITVILMVGVGYVIVGGAISIGRQYLGGGSTGDSAQ